uniref:Uncharacterized protein n=1 Tax=Arundo donax TaxID=35708 RepID=A0A0A9F5E6_ARUDO
MHAPVNNTISRVPRKLAECNVSWCRKVLSCLFTCGDHGHAPESSHSHGLCPCPSPFPCHGHCPCPSPFPCRGLCSGFGAAPFHDHLLYLCSCFPFHHSHPCHDLCSSLFFLFQWNHTGQLPIQHVQTQEESVQYQYAVL